MMIYRSVLLMKTKWTDKACDCIIPMFCIERRKEPVATTVKWIYHKRGGGQTVDVNAYSLAFDIEPHHEKIHRNDILLLFLRIYKLLMLNSHADNLQVIS